MITREDLDDQQQKLINDKKAVVTRLEELDQERQQLQVTNYAIDGALQTVAHFIDRLEQKQE